MGIWLLLIFNFIAGNATATPFQVPHSKAIDDLDEFTLALWINFFWLDASYSSEKNLYVMGDLISTFELYDGFLKYKISGHEDTPYPADCGYLDPGVWHHIAVTKSHSSVTLTVDGQVCPVAMANTPIRTSTKPVDIGSGQKKEIWARNDTGQRKDIWAKGEFRNKMDNMEQDTRKTQNKHKNQQNNHQINNNTHSQSQYHSQSHSQSQSHHNDLKFGFWSGLLSDIRLWDGPIRYDTLQQIYNNTYPIYAHAAVTSPTGLYAYTLACMHTL